MMEDRVHFKFSQYYVKSYVYYCAYVVKLNHIEHRTHRNSHSNFNSEAEDAICIAVEVIATQGTML